MGRQEGITAEFAEDTETRQNRMDDQPQPADGAQPTRNYGPRVWVPMAVVALNALAILALNPIGKAPTDTDTWPIVLIGTMLCLPVQCGLWTAMAPQPLLWRIPLGLAASALFGIVASLGDGDPIPLLLFASITIAIGILSALASKVGGWRLTNLSDALAPTPRDHRNRIRIGYLLGWTSVAAALLTLGRYAIAPQTDLSVSLDSLIEIALSATMMMLLALAPAMLIGLLMLTATPRPFLAVIGLPVFIPVTSLGLTIISRSWQLNLTPDPFVDEWYALSIFSTGAAISMTVTSIALRLAGYRLTRAT